MSTALSVVTDFTPEQMKLITDTVAKGATPDELKLFLYRCKSLGFDPLKAGQIHFVKYGNGAGTIVVGIDGFRTRAMRSQKLSGIKRGVIRNEKGSAVGAWAEVYRTDWQHPARIEVSLAEYSTGRGPWQKMPETMIQKVAEAAALRMAFPDDLGGIYTQEEMDQAEASKPVIGNNLVKADEPGPDDGVQPTDYRIPFGKYKGRSVEDVANNFGLEEMRGYVEYLQASAEKKGVAITGQVAELIEHFTDYIAAWENGPIEKE